MSVRLKNLTALTLAVLYGLVGLTGVSLHSLVEDFSLKDIYAQDLGSEGYFHIHQPDNHRHFHHHHGDRQTESSVAAAVDEKEQSTADLKRYDQFHSPHACPLLTLISQLKLGQGGWVAIRVESDAQHASCSESNLRHAFGVASLVRARGPPVSIELA